MEKSTLAELKAELDQLAKKIADFEKQEKTAKERWMKEYIEEDEKFNYKVTTRLAHYTKESFNLWLEQFNLMAEIQTFAKLRNGDWVADFGNIKQRKHGLMMFDNKCFIVDYCQRNESVYGISFKSAEIATEALKIFGERIEQFYGK